MRHVGARMALVTLISIVLDSSLILNIKRYYQVFNIYFLSLVFESCAEAPS
jgi:hypothetical protein